MKSKPSAHSRLAPSKKRTVSILISLTESRNMASVTHHLPPSTVSLLRGGQEDGRGGGLGGIKEREVATDCGFKTGKGQRTVGFSRHTEIVNSLSFVWQHKLNES